MLDSLIRLNKKYYPQALSEECKYVNKNKLENFINDDVDLSSSDESDNKINNESDNESDSETDN